MNIGVFDSGIGGEAVAQSLRISFPRATITTVSDRENVPYGDKPTQLIVALTDAALQPLLHGQNDIIVIACNTATALALPFLRQKYPTQLFIGIEPMIKPAARITKTRVVAVCATPATLASDRYRTLIETYAHGITLLEPDCRDWAYRIEHNMLNTSHITSVVDDCRANNADVIVLGCTHYHWIKEEITHAAHGMTVLEPSQAIAARVRQLISPSSPSA